MITGQEPRGHRAVDFVTECKEPCCRIIDLAEAPAIPLILPGGQIGVVKLKKRLYPVHHPSQCDVGEPVFRVASSHVGMRPGKPDLLQSLVTGRIRQFAPQRRQEVFAMLVERERMKGVLYVRSKVGVLKLIKLGKHVPEVAWYA